MTVFQTVGLVTHPDKDEAGRLAEQCEAFFLKHGLECVRPQKGQDSSSPDLILTFGGDGTFLAGARFAMKYNVPLLGVNLGTVGFLTEEEPERLQSALESILQGRFETEERMLLRVQNLKTGESSLALNDMVISRGGFARLIRVACSVNGEQYGVFSADGMIAATPTGSTGYSLSAGGPIVDPRMNSIILTPVCAHSLQHCPCILSGNAQVHFRLQPESSQTAELQIDGISMGRLEAGDEVAVTGAEQTIRLIRLRPYRFFEVLRTKLIEWSSDHR